MKGVVMTVILAGLVQYGTIYSSPVPAHSPEVTLAITHPQLVTDPDDQEDEDRVSHRRKP